MKPRTLITVGALLLATALPSVGAAQRYHRSRPSYGGYYGSGPFCPSYVPSPGYRRIQSGTPYRSGGATFYFGSGGGSYGSYGYPSFIGGYNDRRYRPAPYYARPYRHRH